MTVVIYNNVKYIELYSSFNKYDDSNNFLTNLYYIITDIRHNTSNIEHKVFCSRFILNFNCHTNKYNKYLSNTELIEIKNLLVQHQINNIFYFKESNYINNDMIEYENWVENITKLIKIIDSFL
jgi:hypothetical protein